MRGVASFIVVVYGMDLQQPYPPLQERFKAPDVRSSCVFALVAGASSPWK
jgi:hypothetical protein